MNILLIGSGGREHALAWKIAQSALVKTLFCAPGNAGIAQVAQCAPLDVTDHGQVIAFCRSNRVDLVVIGPEAPLAAGLVDDLASAGIKAFGPTQAAAQLEVSKGFTKDLCREFGIPTAAYRRFDEAAAARVYIREQGAPIVVKADGLAAGKGVVVAASVAEAEAAIDAMLGGGGEVVIEQCLVGEEASFFVLCDGEDALPLVAAQDHKRAFDGDSGPNTGGMGAYSPAAVMDAAMTTRVMAEIIRPTLRAMAQRGTPYRGVLFAGLMMTDNGPQLIEYNARFGDPETQVLMMRLQSDLVPALLAACNGRLGEVRLDWSEDAALTVVMAANGYPGTYAKGTSIRGLDEAATLPGVQVFHAGTIAQDGAILANGGRVLNVTARGASVREAQARAYAAVDAIDWPEGFCRRDIGWRAVEREQN
jgi:phosphoribosylamine--glycine ligase